MQPPCARSSRRSPADLLMIDINLPGEDGLKLTREQRERSDVGIILVTGRTDRVDRIVGLEMGADDYVTKPFDQRELLARVKNLLRGSGVVGWRQLPARCPELRRLDPRSRAPHSAARRRHFRRADAGRIQGAGAAGEPSGPGAVPRPHPARDRPSRLGRRRPHRRCRRSAPAPKARRRSAPSADHRDVAWRGLSVQPESGGSVGAWNREFWAGPLDSELIQRRPLSTPPSHTPTASANAASHSPISSLSRASSPSLPSCSIATAAAIMRAIPAEPAALAVAWAWRARVSKSLVGQGPAHQREALGQCRAGNVDQPAEGRFASKARSARSWSSDRGRRRRLRILRPSARSQRQATRRRHPQHRLRDPLGQRLRRQGLADERGHAGSQMPLDLAAEDVGRHRQHRQVRARQRSPQRPRGRDAVHARQADVHHHQFGRERRGQLQRRVGHPLRSTTVWPAFPRKALSH